MKTQPPQPLVGRPQHWVKLSILITLIASAGILAYSNILNNFFLSDDFVLVALLQKLGPFGLWVNQQHGQSLFFRPVLSFISFLDYQLWGTHPLGYHLTNLGFHLLNGLWVGLMTLLLTSNLEISQSYNQNYNQNYNQSYKRFLPYFAGFIFLLLPSHSEAVSWISARTDVISTCFGLSSFVAYLTYKHYRHSSFLLVSLVLFLCALLSKESLVTYPGLILAYELYGLIARKYQRRIFRTGFINFSFYLGILGVYLLLRCWKLGELVGGYGETVHLNFNPGRILQNIVIYPVRTLITPQPGSSFLFWLIACLGLIGLALSCGILGVLKQPASENIPKLQGFLLLAFWIAVLPAITVSVSTWDTQGERYLYFASAFAAIHLAIILSVIGMNLSTNFQVMLGISSGVLLCFGLSLYDVNQNWKIASQMTQTLLASVQNFPQSSIIITSLPDHYKGAYIYRAGLIQALALFDQSNRFNVQFTQERTDQGFEQVRFYTDQIQTVINHSLELPDDAVIFQVQSPEFYQFQLSNSQATFLAWKKHPLVTEDYEVTELQSNQYTLQLKDLNRATDLAIYSAGQLTLLSQQRLE